MAKYFPLNYQRRKIKEASERETPARLETQELQSTVKTKLISLHDLIKYLL